MKERLLTILVGLVVLASAALPATTSVRPQRAPAIIVVDGECHSDGVCSG